MNSKEKYSPSLTSYLDIYIFGSIRFQGSKAEYEVHYSDIRNTMEVLHGRSEYESNVVAAILGRDLWESEDEF